MAPTEGWNPAASFAETVPAMLAVPLTFKTPMLEELASAGLKVPSEDWVYVPVTSTASPAAICSTFVLSSEPVMCSTVPVPAIFIFLALVRVSPDGRTKVPPAFAWIFPELVTLLPKTNSVEVNGLEGIPSVPVLVNDEPVKVNVAPSSAPTPRRLSSRST